MVLHIANGSIAKNFLAGKCPAGQDIIAFNESMITGTCSEDIFSEEFFRRRADSLQVAYERYAELVVAELDQLLNHSHTEIHLWFDGDMFCQINVLTLCAYLDAVQYQGAVRLHIIRHDFWRYSNLQAIEHKAYEINPEGYYGLYRDVLVHRQFLRQQYPVFPEMNEGIKLYEDYLSPTGAIRLAIGKLVRDRCSRQQVIKEINARFAEYGIGDYNIQLIYQSMIS